MREAVGKKINLILHFGSLFLMFISNVGYCFDLSIQGENVCSYYSRYGICKYGPACKHDHPINHAHSSMLTVSAVDQPSLLGQPPGRDS